MRAARIVGDVEPAQEWIKMTDRVDISQVLSGLQLHPLEEGDRAEAAFVLIKVVDGDGNSGWAFRTSEPPNREELLGALMVQTQLLRSDLMSDWDVD